jgi:ribonuclease P protein component
VISAKSMPRAVDRNRLRRRLREHAHAARPALDAYDVILRVRAPVSPAAVPAAAIEGAQLLQRLVAVPA